MFICFGSMHPRKERERNFEDISVDVEKPHVSIDDNIHDVVGFVADEVAIQVVASLFEKFLPDLLEEFCPKHHFDPTDM